MKAISYDGTTFASLNVAAGIPGDLPGPDVSPVLIERFGATPIHAGLGRGARTIPVVFTVKPGNNVETTLMTLLAALDPDDESERELAAQLNAGTNVYVKAAVAGYSYLAVNQVQVLFTASDPAWKKQSRRYSPGSAVTNYTAFTSDDSLTVQNDGQTTALPVVRLKWTGTQRTSSNSRFGWKYRRTIAITNNSTRTLRRYPVYLDLDDTKAWVTASKALASGDDIRIFHNGRELPRRLIGHNLTLFTGTVAAGTTRSAIVVSGTNPLGSPATNYAGVQVVIRDGALKGESAEVTSNTSSTLTLGTKLSAIPANGTKIAFRNTWCWAILDELQAGATATLEIVYGNPDADAPPELTGADQPALDLARSSNGTWKYKVSADGATAAATAGEGLWYVSPTGRDVNALSWDVPGAWNRLNYLDNRDDRTQLRASRVDTGTKYETAASSTTTKLYVRKVAGAAAPAWADGQWTGARVVISGQTRYVTGSGTDYLDLNTALSGAPAAGVALTLSTNVGRFDARRTWQDNAQYPEEGAYDGVMLAHPLGIKRIEGAYSLTNPASIAKFVIVSRASGGEDWAKDLEATATTTSTNIDTIDYDAGAYPIQLGIALSANDDVVIPTSYAKDTGTATSATSSTLTDSTKAWVTDQWAGAKLRIVGGKGSRQAVRDVASNTATVLTLKSPQTFSNTPDDTSRYILTADHKADAALVGTWLTVTVDASLLTITDISAEADVYDVGKGNSADGWLTLYMGGGVSHTLYPHSLVRIGGAGKRLFLPANSILRIDCANRTVRLYDSSEATYTSVPWAVDFYRRTRSGALLRTSDWLPVKASDSKLWIENPAWRSSSLSVEVDLEEAFLG